ncbi:hypothetical protein [Rhizobium sp. RU36D]|uniref:hypothetical protein n=1 Tax=Rhizobium sp. RU36D TaxID=1907415 RepID=UPI0009D8918A|nr:hypothetical protein [Rhizobium sp. RU36D]SMD16346.1 hypothetical protein SAMN05880593_12953 [Rhizobium sp. RU36D]
MNTAPLSTTSFDYTELTARIATLAVAIEAGEYNHRAELKALKLLDNMVAKEHGEGFDAGNIHFLVMRENIDEDTGTIDSAILEACSAEELLDRAGIDRNGMDDSAIEAAANKLTPEQLTEIAETILEDEYRCLVLRGNAVWYPRR